MWFFPTKKEIKAEFEKIKDSFKQRDLIVEGIKKEIVSKKEIELMIKEAVLKVQSEQYTESKSEPIRKKNFERVIYQKAKKMRPEALKHAIRGLIERDMRTTDIYNQLVNEKELCGKTQFYHYLSLVRNELRPEVRTEPKQKLYK